MSSTTSSPAPKRRKLLNGKSSATASTPLGMSCHGHWSTMNISLMSLTLHLYLLHISCRESSSHSYRVDFGCAWDRGAAKTSLAASHAHVSVEDRYTTTEERWGNQDDGSKQRRWRRWWLIWDSCTRRRSSGEERRRSERTRLFHGRQYPRHPYEHVQGESWVSCGSASSHRGNPYTSIFGNCVGMGSSSLEYRSFILVSRVREIIDCI